MAGPLYRIAVAVIDWVELFGIYLVNLQRYFIDWEGQPEVLERFPLRRQHDQSAPYDQIVVGLEEHKRRLLVEAEKRQEILSETLPSLLLAARQKRGITQSQAAAKLGMSLATFKGWEQGKVFPRETKHIQIKRFINPTTEQSSVVDPAHI